MSKKNKGKGNPKRTSPGRPNYKKLQRQQARQANTATPKMVPADGRAATAPVAVPRVLSEPPPDPSLVVMLAPLAPLIIRSGRPFDAQAGPDAPRFPPPSTVAGCLRTAWARQRARDNGSEARFDADLLKQAVTGPLLVRVDDQDQPQQPLVPKPADAQYFGHGDQARCLRAGPQPFEAGCGADLPAGLSPVRLLEDIEEKGSSGPRWWAWEDFIAWRAQAKPALALAPLAKRGWSPPAGDRRTHVAIDAETQTADAGRLFQTEGLDLQPDNPWLTEPSAPTDLRLLARFSEPLGAGLVHLGGERRLARLQPLSEAKYSRWPAIPEGWLRQIQDQQGLTLTLLTPGLFSAGYRPGWLDDQLQGEPPGAPGVRLQLVAVALERWQPHSGWDLADQQPRATRKLVAAGATYWFRLLEAPNAEAIAPLWLASLCDAPQARNDGYGLALPAPWTPTV